MTQEDELSISKHNRRRLQEAEKNRQVIHPHVPYILRKEKRKFHERRINLLVQKARKRV